MTMSPVKQTPSPNYSATPITHDKIFLHRTEGATAEGAAAWLCMTAARASAHLVSNADGSTVYQLVPLQYKAWAQCAFNGQGISIEYPGYTAQGVPEVTLRAMARHTAWLLRAYGIPCRHAKNGQGRGYCMHHDLGAAGGGHTDICDVEDATWVTLEGYIRIEYDALGDGPLEPWALHGLPAPHAVSLPPDVSPTPSHAGDARSTPGDIVGHTTGSGYPHGSVGDMQWWLNRAGATLVVDGHAGPLTRAALVAFQMKAHLAPDGMIGPLTWAALTV